MRLTILSLVLLLILTMSCNKSDPDPVPENNVVMLGAILDLSGDYSEEGLAGKAAIEISVGNLNQRYASVGSPVRFACTYADTHLDTVLTLNAARDMYKKGIRLLVAGPNNSAGLKSIQSFINQNQMLAVTCFSSTPSLAVEGDYIYRLITDDNLQGQALVTMMKYDSIAALIPIWREGAYGAGLYQTVKKQFQDQGGTVLDGISYNPDAANFQELIQQVAPQVSNASTTYGSARVAVILITYQEASEFLQAASTVNDLSLVKWYGCDANVQKASITSDSSAGRFARSTRFLAPIMGIGTAGELPATAQNLSDLIFTKTGLHPDAYALTAYDAVQIYGLSYDLVRSGNAPSIKTVVPFICESYDYLGVSRKLNAAGDLATANYIFWTVVETSGTLGWDSYATYMADQNNILIRQGK
jgi:branched-chain amino acid transport system substrate-binding protein